MLKKLTAWWEVWFLEERPSISLGFFRVAVAATVGLHILPTFFQMRDNYLSTAFREYNPSFFPVWTLAWVDQSPDWLIWAMVVFFIFSWLAFLFGFFTQVSAVLLDVGCYYFYARNSLHIGTLSYDILLVTVFLMLLTPYPGDCLSLDSLIHGNPDPWLKTRPIFIQRLLQLQLASTFFYTGLWKWVGDGNWLKDNPYYYLMHSPPWGVMKHFPLRAFLGAHPQLCYWLGITCILFEMSLPLWLFWRRTRIAAVALGIAFQFYLLVTMHVPTIFFFLFIPQFLLFPDPEILVAWLKKRRERWARLGQDRLVYDGACAFCRACLLRIQALDPTRRIQPVDFHGQEISNLDRRLTPKACHARIHLLQSNGGLSGGFEAFRRMSLRLPMLWPLAPLFYLPGMGFIGEKVYAWVSKNRFGLHRFLACRENACLRDL